MKIAHLNTFRLGTKKPGKNGRLSAMKNRNKNRNTKLFYTDHEMYSRILFVLFLNFEGTFIPSDKTLIKRPIQ